MADDDLTRMLPKPPPPRPDRRDATIAMAMRRFDGAPEPAASPASRATSATPRWRMSTGLAAFASVLLVIAIGLSVAMRTPPWRQAAHPDYDARSAAASPNSADSAALSATPAASAEMAGDAAAVSASRSPNAPPSSGAPASKPDTARVSAPPSASKAESEAAAPPSMAFSPAPAPPAPAEPSPVPAPAPAAGAIADARSTKSAPVADRYSDDSAGDLVVTGTRVSRRSAAARSGDWNACTVNDPAHSLRACHGAVDRTARGDAGVAAGHLSDGLTLAWRGDEREAIDAFSRAIAAKPKLALGYLNRGLAYQQLGDLDKAGADLDLAVRYAPYSARAYYSRSALRAMRGDRRGANADIARAVELDPAYEDVAE